MACVRTCPDRTILPVLRFSSATYDHAGSDAGHWSRIFPLNVKVLSVLEIPLLIMVHSPMQNLSAVTSTLSLTDSDVLNSEFGTRPRPPV